MICPGCWTGPGLPAGAGAVHGRQHGTGRALAIAEAVYRPDHPQVATRLNNLALILKDLGLPAEARPLQERALAITEARRPFRAKLVGEIRLLARSSPGDRRIQALNR